MAPRGQNSGAPATDQNSGGPSEPATDQNIGEPSDSAPKAELGPESNGLPGDTVIDRDETDEAPNDLASSIEHLVQTMYALRPPQDHLAMAASTGNAEQVRAALGKGAIVDAAGTVPEPALVQACRKGHQEVVRILIEAGADANKTASHELLHYYAPLHAACAKGHSELVPVLLEAGAAADLATVPKQWTPLMVACGGGHAACAALLLSAGADAAKASDANGRTALDWAVDSQAELCGRAECARLVLAAGLPAERAGEALVAACNQEDRTELVGALLEGGVPADALALGATPLLAAVSLGHAAVARALLEAGAPPSQGNGQPGVFPITLAGRDGRLELVQLLSSHGANRDPDGADAPALRPTAEVAAWLCASAGWATPLHHLEALSPERARALLRGGASVDAGTPSPLQRARAVGAGAPGREAAVLVLQAAAAWSPATHALWPHAARARASLLVRMGWKLARSAAAPGPFSGEEQALVDVWRAHVMPHVMGERALYRMPVV